jgi:Protein of unknown function (DUF2934)
LAFCGGVIEHGNRSNKAVSGSAADFAAVKRIALPRLYSVSHALSGLYPDISSSSAEVSSGTGRISPTGRSEQTGVSESDEEARMNDAAQREPTSLATTPQTEPAVLAAISSADPAARERAYAIWEEEGCPQGKDLDHWLRAEAEIGSAGQPHVRPEGE